MTTTNVPSRQVTFVVPAHQETMTIASVEDFFAYLAKAVMTRHGTRLSVYTVLDESEDEHLYYRVIDMDMGDWICGFSTVYGFLSNKSEFGRRWDAERANEDRLKDFAD